MPEVETHVEGRAVGPIMMANNDPDRDLLFGLLALQTGLIDQEQLVAAFRTWAREKARPMERIFADRGDLDDGQRGLIAGLVAEHLKKYGPNPAVSLAAIDAKASTLEALMEIGDVDLTSSMARAGRSRADAGSNPTLTFEPVPGSADGRRFHVLRPHARGGLGVVFVALDRDLHREVALKEIQEPQADDPASRARFVLEAEITGGLEHPGIVPVYGLGSYRDGRPYYAMRFIRGDSLKSAIADFHDEPALKADAGARGLALRKLLRRFVDVCNAIEYAHGRGVLHRDLKPANVMVGKYGETLVVDWGLAKATGRHRQGADAEERTLVPRSSGGSSETLPGSAIGTPAYMSPEQAAGDLDRLGPRSDVYSLGATLYCLLAGRSPFEGPDAGAILHAVREGRFPAPRSIDASIPAGLEAIALKAMALEPEDRYGSPRSMAEDVERWMADEPISARRDPWTARAARWGRRNRPAVVGAAAVLVSAVVALSVGTILLGRANSRVQQQRRLADENARLARSAVEDYLTKVSEDRLLKSSRAGMQALRKELLSTALGYYQEFVRRREGDSTAREDLAAAYFRLAEINADVSSKLDAERYFRASYELWNALAADRPEVIRYQLRCAEAENRLGDTQVSLAGRTAEGETHLRDAAGRLEGLRGGRPDDPDLLLGLSRVHRSLSTRASRTRPAEERALLGKAIEATERLVRVAPGKYDADLAGALMDRGYRLARDRAATDAFRDHERARDILLRLTAASPHDTDLLIELARAYVNIGFVHQLNTGNSEEARRQIALSAKIDERLVAENPRVASHRVRLAGKWKQDLDTRIMAGQRAGVLELTVKIIAMLESALMIDPDNLRIQLELASANYSLGELLGTSQPDRARSAFEKAISLQKKAIKGDPTNLRHRYDLTYSQNGLALALIATGKPEEAIERLRGFIADSPVEGLPDDAKRARNVYRSMSEAVIAKALLALERRDEAISALRRVLTVYSEAVAIEPKSAPYRDNLLLGKIDLGMALREVDPRESTSLLLEADAQLASFTSRFGEWFPRRVEVRAALGEALPARRRQFHAMAMADVTRAVAAGLLDAAKLESDKRLDPLRSRADFRELQSRVRSASEERFLTRRAAWDLEQGGVEAASEDYLRAAAALEGLPRPSPTDLYNLGCHLARASRWAKASDRDSLAARAMGALRRASAAGFGDLAQFRADADLDTLRPRADFQLLLLDLAFPSKPFSAN